MSTWTWLGPVWRRIRRHRGFYRLVQMLAMATPIGRFIVRATPVVQGGGGCDLPRIDLRHLPEDKQEERLATWHQRACIQGLPCDEPERMRCLLVRRKPSSWTLLILIDHIAADGGSVPILARDLIDAYTALAAGSRPAGPVAGPMPHRIASHLRAQQWQRTRAMRSAWAPQLERIQGDPSLPVSCRRSGNVRPEVPFASSLHRREIGPGHVQAMLGLAAREHASPLAAILAAVAAALHEDTGRSAIPLILMVSERQDPRWSGMVGTFLRAALVVLDADAGSPLLDQARHRIQACLGQPGVELIVMLMQHVLSHRSRGTPASPQALATDRPMSIVTVDVRPPLLRSGSIDGLRFAQAEVDDPLCGEGLVLIAEPGSSWWLSMRFDPNLYDADAVGVLLDAIHKRLLALIRESPIEAGGQRQRR